eukprot:1754854-Rhodomonas_salina.1
MDCTLCLLAQDLQGSYSGQPSSHSGPNLLQSDALLSSTAVRRLCTLRLQQCQQLGGVHNVN